MLLAVVVGLCALASGFAGFHLDPDTGLYASNVFTIHSPLAWFINGRELLVLINGIAAALCVYFVPQRRRWWYAPGCLYWFLFPGVDALGALGVALYARARSGGARAGWLTMAAAAHPVAALTTFPVMRSVDRTRLVACAVLALGAIALVGVVDTFQTTDRYVLPLVTLAAVVR
jgi:hypothetical protein